ncbi:MAG: hypothetical protein QOD83_3259 [Solirubrobacteraceae bacterium]|nr:hypothetical protein [Solirubrobacteraceae bacterium]
MPMPLSSLVIRVSRRRLATAASLLTFVAVPLALSACGADENAAAEPKVNLKARTATEKDYDPKNFSADSIKVDNVWHPLRPGTQFVFQGRSNRGHGQLPHKVIFTVTDLTKVIDGVNTVVLFDRDINNGKLLEAEITFFAQDKDANVWNFGEYPEEYAKDGSFDGAPSTWMSGIQDAQAGILMRGDPRPGTPSYKQGDAPKINFGDTAKVLKTGQKSCVPVKCFKDVLVIDETNPLEPEDGHQLKYYAPGVGNVSVAPGKGGKEREILELTAIHKLSPAQLTAMREGALKLDRRAYKTVKKVWATTERAVLAK